MPFTDYLDQALNQEVFGNTAYSVPPTLYVGLSTTTPTQAKGTSPYWNFTEPSGNAYARVTVANNTSNWTASGSQPANGQEQQNAASISFATASGTWGTVTYFGIFDASSNGNLLAFGQLSASQTITTNDTASFGIGALTITID